MSYEQLMHHAQEIQAKAVSAAFQQHGVRPDRAPGQPEVVEMPGEAEARAGIRDSFADVPALFEPFTMLPDPASFDGMVKDLEDAMNKLSHGDRTQDPISGLPVFANQELTKIAASESYIENWTGAAADRFRTDFVHTFPAVVANQFIACSVLRNALMAQREIWVKARNDIDKIAHDTLNALDNMDHCGQNTWTMSWTIAASVAAVAAVPISAGTSLGALAVATSVTAVGATSQVIAAHQVDPPKQSSYHGETAEVVVEQTRRGVAEAISQIQHSEQKIAGALALVRATMDRKRELFVAPRPKLADATAGNILDETHLGRPR